ncbi:hypothetical protein ACGC1H_007210 [Rhizoctonia solani]|uniref:F-box domain-containing protein n=1 Tax=Rhizoctonia solani TaxID=456999 RepID=A0A8H2X7I0_9AGAM|nr:unnamed protein product [Rhizoctonia solani]
MSNSLTKPISAAIEHWEEAGTALFDALSKYMNLCNSLKATLSQEGFRPFDLACRVEATLGVLRPKLDQQLNLLRVTIPKTRNEIVPTLHHLPEEVLSEIFMNVVFRDDVWEHPDDSRPLTMEDSLMAIQKHRHCLLQVCSMWRNVLLARDVFWSMVGTYNLGTDNLPRGMCPMKYMNLPLRGTEGANLNLVLVVPLPTDFGLNVLKEHAPRLRTINISAGADYAASSIKHIIDTLLKNTPSLLSELSISHDIQEIHYLSSLGNKHIVRHGSSDWTRFLQIVKSLSALRITGLALSWRHMMFSNRPVELRLQRITLGRDSELPEFLNALSSAPELRDLKLISAMTFYEELVPLGRIQERQHITLPKLESLLLEDLFLNTLDLLSQWLIGSTCRLTLHLTEHSLTNVLPDYLYSPLLSVARLSTILKSITVDTLVISHYGSLILHRLHDLLRSVPTLKILKLGLTRFSPEKWEALKPPCLQTAWSSDSKPSGEPFPKLEELHLPLLWVENAAMFEGLKDLVTSHPLQKLVLGKRMYCGGGASQLEETDAICVWLRSHVPDFRLVRHHACAPEFHSRVWPLW